MTYTRDQMREYQRKRLGFKPRAQCPHGLKTKVSCYACKKANEEKRTHRYRTDPEYREARRASVRESVRKRTLPTPTRQCPDVCECCGGPPNGKKSLALDHDHITGLFRGWLCAKCNRGIGLIGDDISAARRVVVYLERA
jgi:hypothetical protein